MGSIISIIVGVIFVLLGIGWAVMCMMAAGMASRPVRNSEIWVPASVGIVPVLLGLALVFG